MRRHLIIYFLISLCSFSIKGQTYFNHEYYNDTSTYSDGGKIALLSNNQGYITVSNIRKSGGPIYIKLMRIDLLGDTVWAKVVGSPLTFQESNFLGSLLNLGDTNFVFCGLFDPDSVNPTYATVQTAVYRMDVQGNILDTYIIGDDSSLTAAQDIELTSDNGFIITGWIEPNGANKGSSFLTKLDSNGNEEWFRTYSTLYNGYNRASYSVELTGSGGYVLAGSIRNLNPNQLDVEVFKTDSLGNVLWAKSILNLNDDGFYSFVSKYLNTGDFILTGAIDIQPAQGAWDYQMYVARINGNNGSIVWSKSYGINGNSYEEAITNEAIILNDSSINIIGYKRDPTNQDWSATLMKLNSTGDLIWEREYNNYGGNAVNIFWDFKLTPDGGFIMCGEGTTLNSALRYYWIVKTDSLGCQVPLCSVGLNELSNNIEIQVYPNPTYSSFTLELQEQPKNTIFKLFDISGKEVYSEHINNSITTIDVSSFQKGIYIYQITSNEKFYSGKIIVN